MQPEAPRVRRNLISLTPLIDVVFILLVFFMLASSFAQWRTADVQVAESGAAGQDPRPVLRLTLQANGGVAIAGKPLAWEQAVGELRVRTAAEPRLALQLAPEPGVPLQQTLSTLENLRDAGFAGFALGENPKGDGS